jgi:hypothetical protein
MGVTSQALKQASPRTRGPWRVALLSAVLVGLLLAGCGETRAIAHHTGSLVTPSYATPVPTTAAALPAAMPDHFSFGLMNSPGDVGLMNDMRANNGAAWDFRYQYLSGGVNTRQGWETWNTPSGQFAANYVSESVKNSYLPALVYYEMLQSSGPCPQCGEAQRDLAHLGAPSVMSAYFANWRLLMRTLAASGQRALVIVEPDLWAFVEQSVGVGGTASTAPAAVASSGDEDAQGLPNTAQGFAWALLRIRARYAPNILLALHVSNWGTGIDVGSTTQALLDVPTLARATAQFYAGLGVRGNPADIPAWDLISNDVADHDSAQGSAWWDRTNTLYPNFARYLTYLRLVVDALGKRAIMWQVPEGNQFFATMNNSPHHTQDNRAEYILAHIADFAQAGVAAVLFGPGNDGTNVDDVARDGVVNFAPITDFECDRCNVHRSTYPDDDGGYLRLFVGAYYRAGPLKFNTSGAWTPFTPPTVATLEPLPAGTCEFTPHASVGKVTISPNPAHPGQQVTIVVLVTTTCNTTAAVEAIIRDKGYSVIILQVADNSEYFVGGQVRTITLNATLPETAATGYQAVDIGVFSTSYTTIYAFASTAATVQITG